MRTPAAAHHWYSIFLLSVGRVDEALEAALRARELDPLSQVINLHWGWTYYLADQIEPAQAAVQRSLSPLRSDARLHALFASAGL